MRKLLSFFLPLLLVQAQAQNVGIGTTTPTEKLDVNGNLNVNGNIKIAGVAGQDGQVLMSNSSGATIWADLCDYKNKATFTTTGAGSWTAPAGVTKIVVELWGSGGGGNMHAGGGSGAYMRAQLAVVPATTYNFNIGLGGSGATNATANGGIGTIITVGSITLNANGGGGASYSSLTNGNAGAGGTWLSTIGFTTFIAMNGQAGQAIEKTFMQTDATTFQYKVAPGKGGDAPGAIAPTGGIGVSYTGATGGTAPIEYRNSGGARQPGGGGGSGFYFSSHTFNGGNGANGMIVIHY